MANPSVIQPLPSVEALRERLSYDPDSGLIRIRATGRIVGCKNDHGYMLISFERRLYRAHRIAWKMHFGHEPDGEIDHINRDPSDNRLVNLRVVSPAENQLNKGPYSGNLLKGACFDKGKQKWKASIRRNGKLLALGYFATAEEAHAAFEAAECRLTPTQERDDV